MSKMFDLVAVKYDEFYNNEVSIYEAPKFELFVGDEVETDFGRGTVVDVYDGKADEPLFKFIHKYRKLHRVRSVLRKLEYDNGNV